MFKTGRTGEEDFIGGGPAETKVEGCFGRLKRIAAPCRQVDLPPIIAIGGCQIEGDVPIGPGQDHACVDPVAVKRVGVAAISLRRMHPKIGLQHRVDIKAGRGPKAGCCQIGQGAGCGQALIAEVIHIHGELQPERCVIAQGQARIKAEPVTRAAVLRHICEIRVKRPIAACWR